MSHSGLLRFIANEDLAGSNPAIRTISLHSIVVITRSW